MTTPKIDLTDLNLTADAPKQKKLTKGQQKILTYLTSLGPGAHKVPRPRMAAATGLADDTVTRLASALATAGHIAITGSGLETRIYEVLSAGATAMPQPEPVTSRVEKAMAEALARLPDYGQTVESQVPYARLIPTYTGKATADHVATSKYGMQIVIESGPLAGPDDERIDERKRRACQAAGIRILFVRKKGHAKAFAETIAMWLRGDPKAPARAAEVMPNPLAVNDGRDWQHFHATGEVRPYVERTSLSGPGTTYTVLPLPAEVVAEQARAKALAEAKAYWHDMLPDDDEPAPAMAEAPTPSEPVNEAEPNDDQIARAEAADAIARAGLE
jgi:hypothetical protein